MSTDYIVSEIQLKYKPQPLTETINSAKDIHKLLINRVYNEETIGYKETFKVLLLNNANKIIGYTTISDGGLTSTIVDVRVIMQTALVSNASAIILTHNHPSGNTRPSSQDDNLTKKIKAACEIMDIRLLDHIIVTPYDSFYSYCDEGRL
ncbi:MULTISPECIES: JAB domain-containing protein [Bacteroidales]|uniref:JAB domain-containing protein n=1 Tax=Bacteroidales TaxID=171549 RepID=UPI0012B70711|nr:MULTISPECIES: JAB domain-containing protein [Bacteroidales]